MIKILLVVCGAYCSSGTIVAPTEQQAWRECTQALKAAKSMMLYETKDKIVKGHCTIIEERE